MKQLVNETSEMKKVVKDCKEVNTNNNMVENDNWYEDNKRRTESLANLTDQEKLVRWVYYRECAIDTYRELCRGIEYASYLIIRTATFKAKKEIHGMIFKIDNRKHPEWRGNYTAREHAKYCKQYKNNVKEIKDMLTNTYEETRKVIRQDCKQYSTEEIIAMQIDGIPNVTKLMASKDIDSIIEIISNIYKAQRLKLTITEEDMNRSQLYWDISTKDRTLAYFEYIANSYKGGTDIEEADKRYLTEVFTTMQMQWVWLKQLKDILKPTIVRTDRVEQYSEVCELDNIMKCINDMVMKMATAEAMHTIRVNPLDEEGEAYRPCLDVMGIMNYRTIIDHLPIICNNYEGIWQQWLLIRDHQG